MSCLLGYLPEHTSNLEMINDVSPNFLYLLKSLNISILLSEFPFPKVNFQCGNKMWFFIRFLIRFAFDLHVWSRSSIWKLPKELWNSRHKFFQWCFIKIALSNRVSRGLSLLNTIKSMFKTIIINGLRWK